MAELLSDQMAPYVSDANEAMEIRLIVDPQETQDDDQKVLKFSPSMTHQIYGEQERIFGYRGLKIRLYYSCGRLTTFLGISYLDKVRPDRTDCAQADDVEKPLAEVLQPHYCTNIDEFIKLLPKDETFVPHGDLIHSFKQNGRTFQVFSCEVATPGFADYLKRMQTFVLLFIDAGSFIDPDDEKWMFYVMYEKLQGPSSMYMFVGFCSVYHYYAYPSHIRPRISQLLMLPPFQHMGLGAMLLQKVYESYWQNPLVRDITVEEPSPECLRLRDFLDACNCIKLEQFQPACLKKGYTKAMYKEANQCYKLSQKQAKHIYQLLRMKATNLQDSKERVKFWGDVKRRATYETRKKKNRAVGQTSSNPLEAKMAESKEKELDKMCRELEHHYSRVIERMNVFGN